MSNSKFYFGVWCDTVRGSGGGIDMEKLRALAFEGIPDNDVSGGLRARVWYVTVNLRFRRLCVVVIVVVCLCAVMSFNQN